MSDPDLRTWAAIVAVTFNSDRAAVDYLLRKEKR